MWLPGRDFLALQSHAIRARVEGFLEGIHFKEGSTVDAGALLYSLESQPFEADEAAKLSKVPEGDGTMLDSTLVPDEVSLPAPASDQPLFGTPD